jgi:signal transduction histidine kinase
MRPLDRLGAIKVKLGVVIVATVAVTVLALWAGRHLDIPLVLRGLIAAALGLAMVQFLARGMTSPLREMAAAASAMSRGDYGRRVRATSRDEVGDLARAFNAMAAELADVDRVRRELVANVSHELRTPLGALQALLENLADGVSPPSPAALRTALGQTERLGRLVEQLLDLSRLESGVLALRPAPFPVRPLLEQATRECELGEAFVSHPVWLRVDVQPGDLRAVGDPERMHQVVANLLDNAVRHSPPEGRVWLVGYNGGRNTTIAVCDEGPGIPPEEAQRVFERFYRSDAARSTRDGGTGLGLAIARWIVDAHGGSIRAEQRDPHGCRMVLELPAAPPPLKAGPLRTG